MTKLRAVLQRRWPLLAAATVLGVIAGAASALLSPGQAGPSYRAEQVLVATTQGSTTANVVQDSLKVSRGEVPVVAAELLGESGQEEKLARSVDVEVDEDSDSITLVVTDSDPEQASNIVQAFSQAFLQIVNAELQGDTARQLEQLEEGVSDAEARLAAFDEANASIIRPDVPVEDTPAINALLAERQRLAEAVTSAEQRLTDFQLNLSDTEAYSTLGPERPQEADELLAVPTSLPFRAGLLGVLGLLLGIGLVVLVERFNRRIDTREELAALVKVPILAEIGHLADDQLPQDRQGRPSLEGAWSEHYRRVRSAIQFVQTSADPDEPAASAVGETAAAHAGAVIARNVSGRIPRIFMFVSALPGEGKSTSTLLTGMALAETGDETVIINADFRRPSMEAYLQARPTPSLEDLAVLSPNRPAVDEVVQHTGIDHLWLAAAGPPTLEVEGRLMAARELAVEAARRGGTVLIDSSPLQVANDPIDLLPVVDEVVLVVRAGQSTAKSLEQTLSLLDMHHASVLGVVLIGTASTQEMYGYYGAYLDQQAKPSRRGGRRSVSAGFARGRTGARRRGPLSPRPSSPPLNGHRGPATAPTRPDAGGPQVPPVGAYAGQRDRFSVAPQGQSVEQDREWSGSSQQPPPPADATPPPLPPQYQGDRARGNPFAPRPRS